MIKRMLKASEMTLVLETEKFIQLLNKDLEIRDTSNYATVPSTPELLKTFCLFKFILHL